MCSDASILKAHSRRFQAGFTLLEILIVLLIVGLLSGMSGAYLMPGLERRQAVSQVQGLASAMGLAQYKALLNGKPYGLDVGSHEYSFVVYANGGWQPAKEAELSPKRFEGQLYKSSARSGAREGRLAEHNLIVFSPNGEPVSVALLWQFDSGFWQLSGNDKGQIKVSQNETIDD
jgi:type II secretion system protein H